MRIKLLVEAIKPARQCWYEVTPSVHASIDDLITSIDADFKLDQPNSLRLEIDGFELLGFQRTFGVVKEDDLVRVFLREKRRREALIENENEKQAKKRKVEIQKVVIKKDASSECSDDESVVAVSVKEASSDTPSSSSSDSSNASSSSDSSSSSSSSDSSSSSESDNESVEEKPLKMQPPPPVMSFPKRQMSFPTFNRETATTPLPILPYLGLPRDPLLPPTPMITPPLSLGKHKKKQMIQLLKVDSQHIRFDGTPVAAAAPPVSTPADPVYPVYEGFAKGKVIVSRVYLEDDYVNGHDDNTSKSKSKKRGKKSEAPTAAKPETPAKDFSMHPSITTPVLATKIAYKILELSAEYQPIVTWKTGVITSVSPDGLVGIELEDWCVQRIQRETDGFGMVVPRKFEIVPKANEEGGVDMDMDMNGDIESESMGATFWTGYWTELQDVRHVQDASLAAL